MAEAVILSNKQLHSDYYAVTFDAGEIGQKAQPGQFVHVRVGTEMDYILRRPFSIHNADSVTGHLTVVYKIVGNGTKRLSELAAGQTCDLLGPLGKGYTPVAPDCIPIMVAGGYGSAAMYMLARNAKQKGFLLLGARGQSDIILADRYETAGTQVRISTNDGSVGQKGLVTELLPQVLEQCAGQKVRLYACGPHPMLMALAKIMQQQSLDGELSLDHLMCCGVGACFSCVVKIKDDSPQKWRYARTCVEGPVFDVNQVYTEN